ncbi:aldo/keto reductase [Streptomyces capillispiralis]|uniref:Aryl-alcohol dehydrogenase-like predicted oxidoreductase n=1 Tax=Streptomyces capillispiralis TaxID=68182 RepID=A0A561TBP8_9ACTN|nr:aldo/keto reductase [Streptomyces capillispiralis]TWF84544.1 aryl-alcohol dehydrogenase-like predicted oxidoreductase [Streptomyces capillispiralis]GHH92091.1 oxidoreductase [Streptomyces capillispiralis]
MAIPQRTIVLGTLGFGTSVDQETSFRILDRFTELGGTALDTANNYAFWADGANGDESELVLGAWLADRGARDSVSIGTKVGARPSVPGGGLESAEGLSEKVIRAALEDSLRRLRTDRVEVYWSHIEDRSVPLDETVHALADLVDSGKAGELGVSNHAVWRVERARALAGDRPRYTHLQYRYSYLQPRLDLPLPSSAHVHVTSELLDYARSEPDLRLWAYSPLLSGGYTRADVEIPAAYDHPGTEPRLTALREVADEVGATVNQVVLAWLLDHDPRILPIVGVSRVAQVEEAMGALDVVLDPGQRERLDRAGR